MPTARLALRRTGALSLATLLAVLLASASASAGPIYVYKDKDGTVHFSSVKPPTGISAKVFTARSSSFSYYNTPPLDSRGAPSSYAGGYNDLIRRISQSHNLDPALVKAVIHVESAFNAHALSSKGAQGLMQLMPKTAKLLGVSRPFQPEENIRGGTRYLAYLLRRFGGNTRFALAAYNAGPEAISKWQGIPPYPETRQYVSRVLQMHAHYSSL